MFTSDSFFCHVYDDVFGVPGRVFREVELGEPIRYALGDPVEGWLNELLCLNAANHIPKLAGRYALTTSYTVLLLLGNWP
jgi:tRNA(Met) C34 N-acetyltransferase TmcA